MQLYITVGSANIAGHEPYSWIEILINTNVLHGTRLNMHKQFSLLAV